MEGSLHPSQLGWLPLTKLTSFKRMQTFLQPEPAGLGSVDAIANALQASSEVVECRKFGADGEDGAGWFVRRKAELKRAEDSMVRSLYVKGFPIAALSETPTDEEKAAVKASEDKLQLELEAWLRGLQVGTVKSVRMRRDTKGPVVNGKPTVVKGRGKFKGSIFVEFADKAAVDAFLALDLKPTFNGAELESMTKSAYVEMKRLIYAPDSKPIAGPSAVPRNPRSNSAKPFNAWAEHLVGPHGVPAAPAAAGADGAAAGKDSRKRKADDGVQEREVLFDGVRFTARKLESGDIEIVDEATVGTKDGEWTNKVLRFNVGSKAAGGAQEDGEHFNFAELKKRCTPLARPGFFSLLGESNRPIAALPEDKDKMAQDRPSEFPVKLTAPPTIGSAADAAAAAPKTTDDRQTSYPAKGQASFRDTITDELLDKLKADVGTFEGRSVEWVRVSRKLSSSSAPLETVC